MLRNIQITARIFTPAPIAERSTVMSVSVCVCVCLSVRAIIIVAIYGYICISTEYSFFMHVSKFHALNCNVLHLHLQLGLSTSSIRFPIMCYLVTTAPNEQSEIP